MVGLVERARILLAFVPDHRKLLDAFAEVLCEPLLQDKAFCLIWCIGTLLTISRIQYHHIHMYA